MAKLSYLCRIRQLSDEEWGCIEREGEAESDCNGFVSVMFGIQPGKQGYVGTNEKVK